MDKQGCETLYTEMCQGKVGYTGARDYLHHHTNNHTHTSGIHSRCMSCGISRSLVNYTGCQTLALVLCNHNSDNRCNLFARTPILGSESTRQNKDNLPQSLFGRFPTFCQCRQSLPSTAVVVIPEGFASSCKLRATHPLFLLGPCHRGICGFTQNK